MFRSYKFELEPIPPFCLELAVWTLRRRADNLVDQWDGTTYRRLLPLANGPVEVAVAQSESCRLGVTMTGSHVGAIEQTAVTSTLEKLLGLKIDLADFYRFAKRDTQLRPLADRFRGMKPPRFASVFEALINGIACQQLTLTVGIRLLNKIAQAYGTALEIGGKVLHAFPQPSELAGREPSELRELGFSQNKGRAIVELARSIVEGQLDLEGFMDLSDEEAVQRLRKLRGIGRWTAEYVLLRGLGRTHIFPADDVGARNNLCAWLGLTEKLDYVSATSVMSRWSRYGGLIYFHLLLDRLSAAGLVSTKKASRLQR